MSFTMIMLGIELVFVIQASFLINPAKQQKKINQDSNKRTERDFNVTYCSSQLATAGTTLWLDILVGKIIFINQVPEITFSLNIQRR